MIESLSCETKTDLAVEPSCQDTFYVASCLFYYYFTIV